MRYFILNNDREGPFIYWGIGGHDQNPAAIVPLVKKLTRNAPFRLTAFLTEDWNSDLSPWSASAVFGNEAFGGKGPETLKWLIGECIPAVEGNESAGKRFVAGYSLAGLFALWSALSTDVFDGAASCSGSLWFPGWTEFLKKNPPRHPTDIYLSLGDKEERTKNAVMSTVGDRTRATYSVLSSVNPEKDRVTLEWNKGGHFTDPLLRTAKGIAWLISQEYKGKL